MMRRLLPCCPPWPGSAPAPRPGVGLDRPARPAAAAQVQAFATSPRGASNMRDEQAQLRDVFAQAQALTTLRRRAARRAHRLGERRRTTGWAAAQDRLAALSTNSTHRTVDTTHAGCSRTRTGSAESVRAITEVVTAVRTGTPLAAR